MKKAKVTKIPKGYEPSRPTYKVTMEQDFYPKYTGPKVAEATKRKKPYVQPVKVVGPVAVKGRAKRRTA